MNAKTWLFNLLILFAFKLSTADNGSPFLTFREVESATHRNGSFLYFGTNKPIIVDGMFPQVTIQIVELINNVPPKLEFHCVVDKLSQNSPITMAQLCFEIPSSRKLICDSALGGSSLIPDKYKFKSIGDVYNGYIFKSNWERDKFPLDAIYFCRLGNINGVIQSNAIEVQDLDSYTTAFINRRSLDPILRDSIVGSSFPLSLECGSSIDHVELPNWAKQIFPVPYDWVACEAEPNSQLEMRKCYDSSQPIAEYFEHTILPNGTLVIHDLAKEWRPIGILCTTSIIRNKIFSAYFQNHNGKAVPFTYISGTYPNQVIPRSPLYSRIVIRSGWHNRGVITLNALYTANPKTISAMWTKDDSSLPIQFVYNRHSLIFPQDIKPFYAGTYVLSLKSPYETLRFKYEVIVEQSPTIKEAPPRHLIVPQGNQVQVTSEFGGSLTSRSLLINGIQIETLTRAGYRESLRNLQEAFPYVGDLNPEIEFPSETSIRYTVRDLAFASNSPYGSSHIVTMVAANGLGTVRTNTLIRVLPKPYVVRQLSDYSCVEDCFNQTTHRFHCEIDTKPYIGLRVVKTWEFDEQDLERLDPRDNRFTYLNYTNHEVVLNIEQDDSLFDELFANAELSCRFRIFGPETDLFAGYMYETPYYDTKNDPMLHGILTAHIRKYPSNSRMVTIASVSWIVAVVIAVLILLLVAILAACVVMRNKGKTYLLEREERMRGNDPEKEFRDRAAFQSYERRDEPPVLGVNQSLEETFQEVGSDDEGELDYYGMDPGNFTETGSFIGEYSKNSSRTNQRIGATGTVGGNIVHLNGIGPV